MTTSIPAPNNPKYIILYDANGGASYQIPVTVNDDGEIVVENMSVDGLQLTTSGVSDSLNKRFVTDAELANLVLMAPIANNAPAGSGGEVMLASTAGVDLNTATAQTLFTAPSGKSVVITRFVIRLASTSLTTVSFSIGWNSASFNDVVADATHTELTDNTLYTVLTPKIGAKIGTSTQVLKLKNNTLQGGAATCTVEVFGYVF